MRERPAGFQKRDSAPSTAAAAEQPRAGPRAPDRGLQELLRRWRRPPCPRKRRENIPADAGSDGKSEEETRRTARESGRHWTPDYTGQMGALPFPAFSSGGRRDMLSSAAGGGAGAGPRPRLRHDLGRIGEVVSEPGNGLGRGASLLDPDRRETSTTGMAAADLGSGGAATG